MVKIYKYEISPFGLTTHTGRFIGVLKVDWQEDRLCVWCLVTDSTVVRESEITFYSLPTGYEFQYDEDMRYLDSVQEGRYVWHIFYSLKGDSCNRKQS